MTLWLTVVVFDIMLKDVSLTKLLSLQFGVVVQKCIMKKEMALLLLINYWTALI